MQNTYCAMTSNKDERRLFLKKYTSNFIVRFACEREMETEQRLQHMDLPSPSGHRRVSFSFSWTAQPGSWGPSLSGTCSHPSIFPPPGLQTLLGAPSAGWWLSLPHLLSNSKLTGSSQMPLLQGGDFLYHTLSPIFSDLQLFDLQLTDFLSTLSYIIVLSTTQSLEWHVWSSSSGKNCHAIHRSLSSSASVYECTMEFLPCPIFSVKPAYAISSHNCHRNVSLPSGASLGNGMFGRVEGQYTT